MQGIKEQVVSTPEEMHSVIEFGHKARTTHSTAANNTSSRSHAICQIYVTKNKKFCGKLILCDLAGSERAADTQSNSRQRRIEGAEINKSLLALKECIRAMNAKKSHIPFRASKLTLALRDSFMTQNVVSSKIIMIACVCPGSKSSDHTINTLRYADRLKEKQNRNYKGKNKKLESSPYRSKSKSKSKSKPGSNIGGRGKSKNRNVGGIQPAGNKYGGGAGYKPPVAKVSQPKYPVVDALDKFVNNEVNGNPGGGIGIGLGKKGLGKELSQKKKRSKSRSKNRDRERCKQNSNLTLNSKKEDPS